MTHRHICNIKETTAFQRLAPNSTKCKKWIRAVQKLITLDPSFVRARRFFRNKSSVIAEQKRHINSNHPFVIHPLSKANRYREILFVIIWSISMQLSPIRATFGITYREVYKKQGAGVMSELFIQSVEEYLIKSLVKLLLIVSEFFTGYIDTDTKTIIIEPKIIIRRYLRAYYLYDIMALTPGINALEHVEFIRFVHVFGVVVRIGTVINYLRELFLDLNVKTEIFSCVLLAFATFYMLNIFTCLFVLIPGIVYWDLREWPANTWMVQAKVDPLSSVDPILPYSECLCCVVFHFFGAGYGFYPIENVSHEYAVLTAAMFTGRLWTLYIIAFCIRTFSVVTISETKYEEYMLQMQIYMREKKLPKHLRAKLLNFYMYKYQNHFFNETAILSTLSQYLRQELELYKARHLITKVDLFRAFPKTITLAIINSAKIDVYLTHDIIVEKGNIIENIYFIASGTVCQLDEGVELAHLEDGDDIGFPGVRKDYKFFKYSYVALETTEVYVVSIADMRNIIGNKNELLKFIDEKVECRLNYLNQTVARARTDHYDLLSDLSSGKILEHPRLRATRFDRQD